MADMPTITSRWIVMGTSAPDGHRVKVSSTPEILEHCSCGHDTFHIRLDGDGCITIICAKCAMEWAIGFTFEDN
jgi:hypothetical protein